MHTRLSLFAIIGTLAVVTSTLTGAVAAQADTYDPASWAFSTPAVGAVYSDTVYQRFDVVGYPPIPSPSGGVQTGCIDPVYPLETLQPDLAELFPGTGSSLWVWGNNRLPNPPVRSVAFAIVMYSTQPKDGVQFNLFDLPCAQALGLTGEVYVANSDLTTGFLNRGPVPPDVADPARYAKGSNNGIVTFSGWTSPELRPVGGFMEAVAAVMARTTGGVQVRIDVNLRFSPWRGSVSAVDHVVATPVGVPLVVSGDQLREGATWAGDIGSLSAIPFGPLPTNLGFATPGAFTYTATSPGQTVFQYQLRDSSGDYVSNPATVTILATDVTPAPPPEPPADITPPPADTTPPPADSTPPLPEPPWDTPPEPPADITPPPAAPQVPVVKFPVVSG